jgi:uncharacterized membrane protein YphA (DoxX/SURF4 family)
MNRFINLIQLYLRIAIGAGYFVFGLDRLGAWGPNGSKHVAWGDWAHFTAYSRKVMSFLPTSLADILAAIATGAEIILGALLIVGFLTRQAACAGGMLALLFAVSMAISFGIISPMSYSVFTLSAGSFLLATVQHYQWSVDNLITEKTKK